VDADAGGDDGMKELIDKQKLLSDLRGVKEVLSAQGDPFLANIMERAIKCVERQPVIPSEPAESVQENCKLEKAIRELREHYARADKLEYVYNKLGWAIFQTWKKYE
jgi:hypothetical protein